MRLPLEKWDAVVPLVQFILNHLLRKSLGMRCAIEVMTGQRPKDAVDLTLYLGKLLKDATNVDVTVQRVEDICRDLADRVEQLHTEAKHQAVADARKRALRDAKKNGRGAIRFCEGDLVMMAAQGNAANITKKGKPVVNWQGPYEVVRPVSTSEFDVRLLGDPIDKVKPVHWTMMKRFAGPDFHRTPDLVTSAQHDRHKFYVDGFADWKQLDDGEVELLVDWRGGAQTWEPVSQLHEDVPEKVMAYLRSKEDSPTLTTLMKTLNPVKP